MSSQREGAEEEPRGAVCLPPGGHARLRVAQCECECTCECAHASVRVRVYVTERVSVCEYMCDCVSV